ncbi:hypothetical protein HYW18_00485 [Candidatus Uhrbacteria bacterium]|nr:hypothetical protein [Candidatus Uhrbacteria bacterium]
MAYPFVQKAGLDYVISEGAHWIGVRGAPPTMKLLKTLAGEDVGTLKAVLTAISGPALFGTKLIEHFITDKFAASVGQGRARHFKTVLTRAVAHAPRELVEELRDLARQNRDDELKAKWGEILTGAAAQTMPEEDEKLETLTAGSTTFVCHAGCDGLLADQKKVYDSKDKHTHVQMGGPGGAPRQIDVDTRPVPYQVGETTYDEAIAGGYTFCGKHFAHLAVTTPTAPKGTVFTQLMTERWDNQKAHNSVTGALHKAAMQAMDLHKPEGHRPGPQDPNTPDTSEQARARALWEEWDRIGWLEGRNRIVEDMIEQERNCADAGLIRLVIAAYDSATDTVDLHAAFTAIMLAGGYASYDTAALQEAHNHLHEVAEAAKNAPDYLRRGLRSLGQVATDPEVRRWTRKFKTCAWIFAAGMLCYLAATFLTYMPFKGDEMTKYFLGYGMRIGLYLASLGFCAPLILFLLLLHLVWRGGEAILGMSLRTAQALLHELSIELPPRDELRDYDNHWPLLKIASYTLVALLFGVGIGVGSVAVEKGIESSTLALGLRVGTFILFCWAGASGWHTIATKNSSELLKAAAIRKDSTTGKVLSAFEAKPALGLLVGVTPIVILTFMGIVPRAGTFKEGALELRQGQIYQNGMEIGDREEVMGELKVMVSPDGIIHTMDGQTPKPYKGLAFSQTSIFSGLLHATPDTQHAYPLEGQTIHGEWWGAIEPATQMVRLDDLFPCPEDPAVRQARCPSGTNYTINSKTKQVRVLNKDLDRPSVEGIEVEVLPSGYVQARLLPTSN